MVHLLNKPSTGGRAECIGQDDDIFGCKRRACCCCPIAISKNDNAFCSLVIDDTGEILALDGSEKVAMIWIWSKEFAKRSEILPRRCIEIVCCSPIACGQDLVRRIHLGRVGIIVIISECIAESINRCLCAEPGSAERVDGREEFFEGIRCQQVVPAGVSLDIDDDSSAIGSFDPGDKVLDSSREGDCILGIGDKARDAQDASHIVVEDVACHDSTIGASKMRLSHDGIRRESEAGP